MNDVRHEEELHRFVLPTDDGNAVLEYHFAQRPDGIGAVDFTRTWVPPSARGKGMAERLVREGLRWAKNKEFTIQASCWYVAKFLRS